MPNEAEILATKLWTLAKYLKEFPGLVEIYYMNAGGIEYKMKDVIDLSDELHPKVIIILEQPQLEAATIVTEEREAPEVIAEFLRRVESGELNVEQDTAVEAEPSEGDVRSGGSAGQPGPDAASAGSATADCARFEGDRRYDLRWSPDGPTGPAQTN